MGWKSVLIWELVCLCNKLLCYSLAGATANINFLLSLLHGPCTSIKVNLSKLCSIINLSSQMKWVQLCREVQNQRKKSEGQKQSACASQNCVTSCQWCPENRSFSATVFLGLVWQRRYGLCWPELSSIFVSTRCRILKGIWSNLCQLSLISFLPTTHRIFNVTVPAWALGNQKRSSRP